MSREFIEGLYLKMITFQANYLG